MAEKAIITTLIENTAQGDGLIGENGISFWLDCGGKHILFDTGQTGLLTRNAQILGINLADADAVIISHGHYDHTGGLQAVMNIAKKAKLYIHPAALAKKYSSSGGKIHSIGAANHIKDVVEMAAKEGRLVWTKNAMEIFPNVFITGEIPQTTDFENRSSGHFYLDQEAVSPDEIIDDQSIFFRSTKGLVVILGCAHSGIINILEYIAKISGTKKVDTIMGGMHLVNADDARIAETIKHLKKFQPEHIGTAHCTGFDAAMAMRNKFRGKCFMCSVGTKVEFEI